ncbi:MAG: DUF4404 family protein [Proteobacteria bacterium]|jgi:uncharacterized alpha-E superfamily protein|nr:DUF4404 family protein [Pseudomonadota bacterium]
MPKEALRTTLEELRIELDRLHFDQQAHRSRVDRSITELEERLRDESFMTGDEYLVNELQESLTEFEEQHPQLTVLIGRISDLLAKMGI